jgi:hypothetical protein
VLRAVGGAGIYLGVVSLLGLGIGAIVRHSAAAIAGIVAIFFLLPQIPAVLPAPWNTRIADAMPGTAAQVISTLTPNADLLTVGHSYALLLAYAIGVPVLGGVVLCRRDV